MGRDYKKERVGLRFTHPKYGEYEIVWYARRTDVGIKFINTGSIVNTCYGSITKGFVRDPMHPSVCGVGVTGTHKHRDAARKLRSYVVWSSMVKRCYSKATQAKQPTYRGCTVCEGWLYYPNFKKWFDENYIEGYQLDKDIRVKGNKVYSPETCMFVSHAENAKHSNLSKMYKVVMLSPSGTEVTVGNQIEFCKGNFLNSSALNLVINGKRKHHKGWKFVRRLDP